jgi:hypothetical protein
MGKTPLAVAAVVLALGVGAWMRPTKTPPASLGAGSANAPRTASATDSPPPPSNATAARVLSTEPPGRIPTEADLMDRIRSSDPATVVALARQARKLYPDAPGTEEREARKIDALVALDRIGPAHTDAMLFVQRYPSGPYSQHIMNLMGVHPRPPGAVPEPPPDSE